MRDGDQIRIIGTGGAPALLTVGRPFDAKEINGKLATGEWRLLDEAESDAQQEPDTENPSELATGGVVTSNATADIGEQPPETVLPTAPAADIIGRPPQAAPKADWVDHVVRSRLLSREDAENYTKADLIDLSS